MTNPAQCRSQAHHPPIPGRCSPPFDHHPVPNHDCHVTGLNACPPHHTHQQGDERRERGVDWTQRLQEEGGERRGNVDDDDEQTKEDVGTSPQPTPPFQTLTPPQPSTHERHVKRPDYGLMMTVTDEQLQRQVNNHSGSFDNDNRRLTGQTTTTTAGQTTMTTVGRTTTTTAGRSTTTTAG